MSFEPKTFLDLAMAMKTGAVVTICDSIGYVSSIEKEDGSGFNWNVTMTSISGKKRTIFFSENSRTFVSRNTAARFSRFAITPGLTSTEC